ncbi:hypothetical protein ACWD8L_27410 [Streptomyces sp. NPDC005133]|uniref:hypothetical protein n=1 Tax=Streptomyces sp. NPDC005525 TaxID=3364720 RepID=UPI003682B9B0
MTTRTPPAPRPVRDAELRRLLAVVVDTDRDESPFGWSELPPIGVHAGSVRTSVRETLQVSR